jgi:hypothetical protein
MFIVEELASTKGAENRVGRIVDHVVSADGRKCVALEHSMLIESVQFFGEGMEGTFEERMHRFSWTCSAGSNNSSMSGIRPLVNYSFLNNNLQYGIYRKQESKSRAAMLSLSLPMVSFNCLHLKRHRDERIV